MPWPESIGSLLARPDSRAAQALRWGLHGLRASLQATLEEVPLDPGSADLRALLAELAALVDRGQPSAAPTLPVDNSAAPLPPDEPLPAGPPGQLDPRVSVPEDESLRGLADAVSAGLWLAEHDPRLCHCLKSVFRFGLAPLSGDQRERYAAELLRLWERVRTGDAGQGFGGRLRTLLDLDEALHSLVYQPRKIENRGARIEDRGSLSGRSSILEALQGQARAVLFAARDQAARSGFPVHLQELGGSFAEINRLAPDSLQVDFGIPGEVFACVRVWARIDGEELKGRVLYRSPQEGL